MKLEKEEKEKAEAARLKLEEEAAKLNLVNEGSLPKKLSKFRVISGQLQK